MNKLSLCIFLFSFSFTLLGLVTADLLCTKIKVNRRGVPKLKKRMVEGDSCPRGFVTLIDTKTLQGDPGESIGSDIACYAKVVGSSATVTNYGGARTTSATAGRFATGTYDLVCNGDFSGLEARDFTILATPQTVGNVNSTAMFSNLNDEKTELRILFGAFSTRTDFLVDDTVAILVLAPGL